MEHSGTNLVDHELRHQRSRIQRLARLDTDIGMDQQEEGKIYRAFLGMKDGSVVELKQYRIEKITGDDVGLDISWAREAFPLTLTLTG